MMNLFGFIEDKKKNNFFSGLTVAGTKEKKKFRQETWLGYYPFSVVLGHDTTNCIVTQARRGVQQGVMIRPVALRHGPMTRLAGPRYGRPAHKVELQCKRPRPG